jgi:signal transduction histidine kinase
MIPLKYISKVSAQLIQYRDRLSKKSAEEAMAEINASSLGLMCLGENIIQWIRLQEDTYDIKPSSFSLNALIDELLILHKHLAEEKGNIIELDIPEELICEHDPVIIRVILHNLLINANKFTSKGKLGIKARYDGKDIIIVITDMGTGMSAERLEKLNRMEPVTSEPGTHEEVGWGLGYRLILEMLRLTKGKIHIESKPDKGTSVTITLPPLNYG